MSRSGCHPQVYEMRDVMLRCKREKLAEKVYFRSQILECPSIGEYWNIFGVPALPENVIFTFFRTCWCYLEAYNTGTQKWSSIVQCSCTNIWDLKYTFSVYCINASAFAQSLNFYPQKTFATFADKKER